MGRIISGVKKIIRKCDVFRQPTLLRYRDEPQFQSTFGGLLSIFLASFLLIVLWTSIVNTIRRKHIKSTSTFQEEMSPSVLTTKDTPLFFALGFTKTDMFGGPRLFDINLLKISVVKGVKTEVPLGLQPCQRDVWLKQYPSFRKMYDKLDFNKWLCPTSGTIFEFQGKYTSEVFKYVKIEVATCSNISSPQNLYSTLLPCDTPENILKRTQNIYFDFNFYFFNTLINEDTEDYLRYYLEDRYHFNFATNSASAANLFFSSYSIETDQSILPNIDIHTDEGGYVYEPAQVFAAQNPVNYLSIWLRKSSLSLKIDRSFDKLDEMFAYIGGLFEFILTILILMDFYNEFAYEVEVAGRIYYYNQAGEKIGFANIFQFLLYLMWRGLKLIGCEPHSSKLARIHEGKEEIGRQLEVNLILERINFLEGCIGVLFEEYQIVGLHLKSKPNIEDGHKVRKYYKMLHRAKKEMKKHNIKPEIGQENEMQVIGEERGPLMHPEKESESEESFSSSDEENDEVLPEVKENLEQLYSNNSTRARKIFFGVDKKLHRLMAPRRRS